MDNLQGVTYEVFEKDPVKYERYEEVRCASIPPDICSSHFQAVFQALNDRPQNGRT